MWYLIVSILDLCTLTYVAGRERFFVNPSKSHALKYLSNVGKENGEDVFMYNKKIKDSTSATHLDIVRNVNGKRYIEGK